MNASLGLLETTLDAMEIARIKAHEKILQTRLDAFIADIKAHIPETWRDALTFRFGMVDEEPVAVGRYRDIQFHIALDDDSEWTAGIPGELPCYLCGNDMRLEESLLRFLLDTMRPLAEARVNTMRPLAEACANA